MNGSTRPSSRPGPRRPLAALLLAALSASACGPDLRSFGFQPPRRAALAPAIAGLALADFDGDGRADLVTIEGDRLKLRLGVADGSFADGREVPLGGAGALLAVAAGDVNGDGRPDLVVLRLLVTTRAQALLDVTGASTAGRDTELAAFAATALALGDVDGDGRADLALGTAAVSGAFSARVLRGTSDGSFSDFRATSYRLAGDPRLAFADVNKDGRRDLVWASVGRALALRGAGDGSFDPENNFPIDTGAPVSSLAAADLNGDGDADLVGGASSGAVQVALTRGDGTFRAALPYPVGFAPAWVAAGDVDGDGRPDLVAARPDEIAVRRGAGQ